MSNANTYFETVQKWRSGLRSINVTYDERRGKLERFKGSSGYEQDLKKLEAERVAEINALRAEVSTSFRDALANMRLKAGTSKPFTAPSQEQIAILQVLKMLPQVSVEALNRAAVSMAGNSLCLSVLDGIAQEAKHNGVRYNKELTEKELLDYISHLEKDAQAMLRLNRTNIQQENAAPQGDITLYRIDVDPKDLGDCLSRFGNVQDVDGFCTAVD